MGGGPKGWRGGGPALPIPALAQPQSWQEGEEEGSARRSSGEQQQVTQAPSAAPEAGLGIEFRDWQLLARGHTARLEAGGR